MKRERKGRRIEWRKGRSGGDEKRDERKRRPVPESVRITLAGVLGVGVNSALGRIIIHPKDMESEYDVRDLVNSPLLFKEYIAGEEQSYGLSQKESYLYGEMQKTTQTSRIFNLLIENTQVDQRYLNQKDLAQLANVHPNTIANILGGQVPRDFIIVRIFRAYGYDIHHPFTQYALHCAEEENGRSKSD